MDLLNYRDDEEIKLNDNEFVKNHQGILITIGINIDFGDIE